MPPRSKRSSRRRRPNWNALLWLAFFVNLAAGLLASPLTEVRRVRIVGAADWDRGRLVSLAQSLSKKPSAPMNPREFESRVFEERAVETVDLRRSLFGSATLTLRYRTAAASVAGAPDMFLDREGVLFRRPGEAAPLPILRLHTSFLRPSFTLAGGWPARRLADLIRRMPSQIGTKPTIDIDSEAAICFNTEQGARIFLGTADRIDEKLRTLKGLLDDRPDLLRNVSELNLIEPSRPAWKARRGGEH